MEYIYNDAKCRNSQDAFAIYLRKSRADIEEESIEQFDALKKHYEILMDLAVKNGYNITDIYKELVSGDTIEGRPQMKALLDAVKAGKYKGVLVTEISRLARGNSTDQGIVSEIFSSSGTLIITPRKIYDPRSDSDQDFFDFELFMARQEFKYIKRRLKAGKMQAVKQGQFMGSRVPFGYDAVKTEDKKRSLKPNDNARYVKMLSEYWQAGHTERECCYYMESIGAKAPGGKGWNDKTIKYILKSETYIGRNRIHVRSSVGNCDETVDGLWEGILTEEDFRKNNSRFNYLPHRSVKLQTVNKYAGIIKCSRCNHSMDRSSGLYFYHMNMRSIKCDVCGARESEIDEVVCNELKDSISDMVICAESEPQTIIDYDPIIESLKKQLNRIYDLYEKGIYSDSEFMDRRSDLQGKIEFNERMKEEESKKKKVDPSILSESLHEIIDAIKDPSIDAGAKNEFLKGFIHRIYYDRTSHDEDPVIKIEFR